MVATRLYLQQPRVIIRISCALQKTLIECRRPTGHIQTAWQHPLSMCASPNTITHRFPNRQQTLHYLKLGAPRQFILPNDFQNIHAIAQTMQAQIIGRINRIRELNNLCTFTHRLVFFDNKAAANAEIVLCKRLATRQFCHASHAIWMKRQGSIHQKHNIFTHFEGNRSFAI